MRCCAAFFHGATDTGANLADAEQPRLHAVTLEPAAWSVGRTLAEVNLGKVDAGVTAIRRRLHPNVPVIPDTVLQAGDVVVIRGSAVQVAAGEQRLLRG